MSFTLTLYVYLLSWPPPSEKVFNLLRRLTKNPIDDMTDHQQAASQSLVYSQFELPKFGSGQVYTGYSFICLILAQVVFIKVHSIFCYEGYSFKTKMASY